MEIIKVKNLNYGMQHCRALRFVVLIIALACANNAYAADRTPASKETVNKTQIRFSSDVVPIFTKLGCSSGSCHGKSSGQNGFKISLLGFDAELDYRALVNEARGRRIFSADPDRSLLLLKAAGRIPHGGGKRFETDSIDYGILRNWIEYGAPGPSPDDPILKRISLSPGQRVLKPNAKQTLRVTAHFSDGTKRDVTRQTVFESNVPEIAIWFSTS